MHFSWNRGTNSVLWRTMLNIFLMQGISVVSRVVHNYIVYSELDVGMTKVSRLIHYYRSLISTNMVASFILILYASYQRSLSWNIWGRYTLDELLSCYQELQYVAEQTWYIWYQCIIYWHIIRWVSVVHSVSLVSCCCFLGDGWGWCRVSAASTWTMDGVWVSTYNRLMCCFTK